jgi:glycosyltransferase involved in cell wall biosynthesis
VIVLYVHVMAATGVARNASYLAAHLNRSGDEVILLTAVPTAIVSEIGVRQVSLLPTTLRWRSLEKLVAAIALCAWLWRHRPALLLSMGNHGHVTAWLATTAHPPALIKVFRISNDLSRPQGGGRGSRLAQAGRDLGARLLARRADAIVAVAPFLLDHPAWRDARRSGRAFVIENGVDRRRSQMLAQQPPPHPWLVEPGRVVFAAGRLAPQKNLHRLIEAVAALQPDVPCRLLIAGTSRDDMRARLLDHAARLGVGDRVAVVSGVDGIFPWLAHADCFVLPSLWEGAPNVLLEALAIGLPIAASRTAGNAADVLGDDRFGILFDPGDVVGMTRAIGTQLDRATALLPGNRAADYDLALTLDRWRALLGELRAERRHCA